MKTIQDQSFKRLLKKLSAMRATLQNDEREILDAIVTGEVTAHKLSADRAVRKASAEQVAEVAAHKLSADRAVRKASADQVAFRIRIDPSTGQYAQVRD